MERLPFFSTETSVGLFVLRKSNLRFPLLFLAAPPLLPELLLNFRSRAAFAFLEEFFLYAVMSLLIRNLLISTLNSQLEADICSWTTVKKRVVTRREHMYVQFKRRLVDSCRINVSFPKRLDLPPLMVILRTKTCERRWSWGKTSDQMTWTSERSYWINLSLYISIYYISILYISSYLFDHEWFKTNADLCVCLC